MQLPVTSLATSYRWNSNPNRLILQETNWYILGGKYEPEISSFLRNVHLKILSAMFINIYDASAGYNNVSIGINTLAPERFE